MAIHYSPKAGSILLCDFDGYKIPEIVKRRPVIVVSPQDVHQTCLCTIVPISTTPPRPVRPYHYKIENLPPLDRHFTASTAWVKCDLVYTVSYERLFMFHDGKNASGKRLYKQIEVTPEQLKQIRVCILKSIGLTSILIP